MTLEIPAIVSHLLPELFRGKCQPSVICIQTTEPKFLVFGEGSESPACIVQFGAKHKLKALHEVLSRLHAKDHHLVAQPLVFTKWRGEIYVHIQAGLRGRPLYRHRDHFRSPGQLACVTALANEALERLHTAIKSFPDWTTRLYPCDELRAQAEICLKSSVTLSKKARQLIDRLSDHLEELGELSSFRQHGDFCLDNLLLDRSSVAVIDFEEFGRTAMPLHDRMGLELSLSDMWPLKTSAASPVDCLKPGGLNCEFTQEQLSGLYMHHLLFRINQCLERPTRTEIKSELLAMVERASGGGKTSCRAPLPKSRCKRGRSKAAAFA